MWLNGWSILGHGWIMMPEFGVLVPLWPGSSNESWDVVEADNCDEAWEKAKKLNSGVKEIVRLGECDMSSGLCVIPSAKDRGMEEIEAGDVVIVRTTWMSTRDGTECKVEKITKSGKIRLDDGRMFNAVGAKVEPGWGMFVLFKKDRVVK